MPAFQTFPPTPVQTLRRRPSPSGAPSHRCQREDCARWCLCLCQRRHPDASCPVIRDWVEGVTNNAYPINKLKILAARIVAIRCVQWRPIDIGRPAYVPGRRRCRQPPQPRMKSLRSPSCAQNRGVSPTPFQTCPPRARFRTSRAPRRCITVGMRGA